MPRLPYRYHLFALPVIAVVLLFVNGILPAQNSQPQLLNINRKSIQKQSAVGFQHYLPALINPGRSLALTSGYPGEYAQTSFSPSDDQARRPATIPAQPGPLEPPGAARARFASSPEISPDFQQFIDDVSDGQASTVRGLYVEGVLALRVVQQPDKDPLYVASEEGVATQFQNATVKGVTGLLAHNYLSGADFYKLSLGQDVYTVDGDGKLNRYRVDEIQTYQKLKPESPTSDFIDLQTNERKTSAQVFRRVYSGKQHLTLQTCLKKGENWSWGLMFVIASPVN